MILLHCKLFSSLYISKLLFTAMKLNRCRFAVTHRDFFVPTEVSKTPSLQNNDKGKAKSYVYHFYIGKYVACPKSPVTHTFYSEHIAGTNQSYSCRIIGRIGTYFTEQHVAHFNGLTATVTLVTMHRHDRSRSNYAKCFRNFHFSQSAKSI